MVSTDPFGEGWIYVLKMANADDVQQLKDAAAYSRPLGKEQAAGCVLSRSEPCSYRAFRSTTAQVPLESASDVIAAWTMTPIAMLNG